MQLTLLIKNEFNFVIQKKYLVKFWQKHDIPAKKHAENMKNMPSSMLANFTFSLTKEKEHILKQYIIKYIFQQIWK